MNKKQRILLILSIIAYLAVIYSFLTQNMLVLFISFVVSSTLLIAFCLAGAKGEDAELDYLELADTRNSLEILKAEKQELQDKLDEVNKTKESDDRKIRIAEVEIQNARNELEKVKEEENKLRSDLEEVKKSRKSGMIDIENGSLIPATDEVSSQRNINVVTLAKEVIEEFDSFAEKVGVNIRLNSTEPDLEMEADKGHIRIMFRNIIDNSLKYMQTAGTLVITISSIDDKIFIVLKDNGEGLAEDETEHVFELNFQGSNRISGNGLGLAQAKAIVDFYSGDISARSGNGNGMGIYIEIPRNRENVNE